MTGWSGRGRLGGRIRKLSRDADQRPVVIAALLGLVGIAIRHAWLSTRPLASGDWAWASPTRLGVWYPWPRVWDSSFGFSGQNRFLDAFRFPVFALGGLVGAMGGSWPVVEKVVYFIPYAVLLPVAGWLLARELLGSTRWALLTPVILLGNTYFMVEGNAHVPLTLAEAVGCLVLVAFVRSMRSFSLRWALTAGLLASAEAVLDIRPAVITVVLVVWYLFTLFASEPNRRALARRSALTAGAGATFVVTQAFWIIPLVTYRGHAKLPTPLTPNFNILTLGHGLAGVTPVWSGSVPVSLVQAPLNPMFLALPLLAFLPLAARRVRPEFLWLAGAAIICAFLAKTNNPPMGGVYNWLYLHVPGFRLYREGSKFLFPVSVAYAILVPAALRAVHQRSRQRTLPLARAAKVATGLGLAAVVAVAASSVLVLERGQLQSTTTPVSQPGAFVQLDQLLRSDAQPGSILWFGSPLYQTADGANHRYLLASPSHPLVNLTGRALEGMVNRRDALQFFCADVTQPFCYLQPGLFPYLVRTTGSRYIVSPGGSEIGTLPAGIARSWLRSQLTGQFGPPTELGRGKTSLLVWRLAPPPAPIAGYPAIALVDSGPWAAASVLPALEAMGVPAAYRQTLDSSNFTPAPAGLADTVTVLPRFDGGCRAASPSQVAIMAQASGDTADANVAGSVQTLHLLARSSRLPDWAAFGPVSLPAGFTAISIGSSGAGLGVASTPVVGPCIPWSPLAASAFGDHGPDVGPARVAAHGERVSAPVIRGAPAWLELRRGFDLGWRLGGKPPVVVGDGLFNLYHGGSASGGRVQFTFSTLRWEDRGQIMSGVGLVAALALVWRLRRREDQVAAAAPPPPPPECGPARLLAVVGLCLLVLTALVAVAQRLGAPSLFPTLVVVSDPYDFDTALTTAALVVLVASVLMRLVPPALGPALGFRRGLGPGRARRGLAAAAACLLVTSCVGRRSGAGAALANAEVAGAASQFTVGQSLDDARLQRAATHPRACITDYTLVLKTFPSLASAYDGRARCYLSERINAAAAVHDSSRAVELSPDNPIFYLDRATANRAVGDLDAAMRDYQRTAAIPSVTGGELLSSVEGLIAIDRPAQARVLAGQATRRLPGSALVLVAMADVAVATDQPGVSEILDHAGVLAKLARDDGAQVLAHLCQWQVLNHDYLAAVATCPKAAVSSGADGSGAYDDLAAAHAALGQLDAANVDLTSAIGASQGSVGPDAQPAGVDGFGLANLLEARGRLALERHRPDLAIADYRRAVAILPGAFPDFRARLRGDIRTALAG